MANWEWYRGRGGLDRRVSMRCPTLPEVVFFFFVAAVMSVAAAGGFSEAYGLRHGRLTTGAVVSRDDAGRAATVVLRFQVPGRGAVQCETEAFDKTSVAGKATTVRYDPSAPTQSCSTGERGDYWGGVATLAIALSALARAEVLRRRRQRLPALPTEREA